MSINYFLRNEARSSQKHTFARRQWAQHLLFCFSSNIFPNQFDYYCLFLINFFSEIESETLKSELLFEDSGHSICCFFFWTQHLKKIVVPASIMEQLNVSFLLTNTSKLVVGLVILSCKSQVFSIFSEFEHHFQEISLFVKSTILGKSIFEGFDGVEMWWGKKFIY